MYFYKKAASCDHSQACFNLALMHLGHCTGTPDAESEEENNDHLRQEGLTLLEKAAVLGLKEVRQGCRCLHIYFFSDAAKIANTEVYLKSSFFSRQKWRLARLTHMPKQPVGNNPTISNPLGIDSSGIFVKCTKM